MEHLHEITDLAERMTRGELFTALVCDLERTQLPAWGSGLFDRLRATGMATFRAGESDRRYGVTADYSFRLQGYVLRFVPLDPV